MAISQQLAEQLSSAYTSGDIGAVNQLLSANQVGAGDVQSFWNFNPTQMGQLETAGVKYFSPTVSALPNANLSTANTATLTNTGANTGALAQATQNNTGALNATSAASNVPAIVFPTNIVDQSPAAKASLYNTYLEQGFTDAQIRAAANSLSPQLDADWAELQRLAQNSPSYSKIIGQAYGGIGRSGFGTETANIDRPGYDYWMSELTSGRLNPDNFRTTFNRAVDDFITANPTNEYSQQALGTMVNSILNPSNNLTGAQRIAAMTNLQNRYSGILTDAEIARLGGNKFTTDQVTQFLEPVRTFQTNYETVFNDPTAKAQDIVSFVDSSLANPTISSIYGTRLNELKNSNQFKEISRLADVGTVRDYEGNEYNPLTLVKLMGQVGKNINASSLAGGAFLTSGESIGFDYGEAERLLGSKPTAAQQVVLDMARYLMKSGITDISQLGKSEKYQTGSTSVAVDDEGYLLVPDYEGSLVRGRKLTDEELARVKTTQTTSAGGEDAGTIYTSRTFDDPTYGYRQSMSGLDLPSDWDEQMGLRGPSFRFGETYTGKGSTRYNVMYDPETGLPKFGTESKMSGWYDAAPIVAAIATMVGAPYLASALSGVLPGAAVTGTAALEAGALGAVPATAANTAISNALAGGLIQGALTDISGTGSFGEGFVKGGLPGIVNYGLGQVIPADLAKSSPELYNALRSVGTNVITAGLTGQDAGSALTSGLINSTMGAALNRIPGYADLPAAGKVLVNQAVSSAISGGRTDPLTVALAMISAARKDTGIRRAKGGLAMASGGAVPQYEDGGYVDFGDFGDFSFGDLDLGSLDFGDFDTSAFLDIPALEFDFSPVDLGVADIGLPNDLLLASSDTSDLGPFRVDVSGTPTFAESNNASTVPLNFGERLLSVSEIDSRPAGSFYDPMRNAWITGSQDVQDVLDIASQGFGYDAGVGPTTGDFSRIDRMLGLPTGDFGLDSGDFVESGSGELPDLGTVNVVTRRDDGLGDFYEAGSGELPDLGTVNVIGRREDDGSGEFYEAGSGELDDLGTVNVTGRREDEDTDTDADTDTDTDECPEGFHKGPTGVCIPDEDTDVDETQCPPGYIYNLNTRQCEKVGSPPPPPPPPPPPRTPPSQQRAPASAGGTNINVPPVQQLAPLVLQALRGEGGSGRFQDPLERLKETVAASKGSAAQMFQMDPYLESVLRQRASNNYFTYGQEPSIDSILTGRSGFAQGGAVPAQGMPMPLMASTGGLSHYGGRENFKDGKHVAGEGDGQSDDIPAWLADGEFVFPADVVAMLGNGSTKAGTDKLYEMMHGIRKYHRSAKPEDLPPPAKKSPLDYLPKKKGAKA
jgi:hypothetical protein